MNLIKEFVKDEELLKEDDPEEPYRRRKNEEKKSISWGQRKLLMTTISFLSKHLHHENPVLVYAGSAPGVNIGIVSKLFPQVSWHLYDYAKFKLKTDLDKRIFVYRKKFTDNVAKYWAEKQQKDGNIYFISDIRTADYTKVKNLNENEEQILFDMNLQKKWVEIIKPCKSFLKFRLPYAIPDIPIEIEYFNGIIYKQCYSPQTSTETRLIVDNKLEYKIYSCEKYQSQMFHHNIVIREKIEYKNDCLDEPELVNDYDSCCEVSIWKDYLEFMGEEITKERVIELSRDATRLLTKGRKYKDTLSYLRSNPRAIKDRNFNP